MTTPEEVIQAAMDRGLTLACAESLTGGALCTALVSVPGSSEVVLGGIVTYTVGVKEDVLGVDPAIIEAHGVVSRETAIAMAKRVREMFGAEVGAATTGAAGPEPHGGKPAGTVCVASVGPNGEVAWERHHDGPRGAVQRAAVADALEAYAHAVGEIG